MKTRNTFLILMGCLLLLTGCTNSSEWTSTLDRAEAAMNTHPDSAKLWLESLTPDALTAERHRARFALLYSQALDKNYIDETNDSLIRIAVDYYQDEDDARSKFLSYYYLGRVYANAGQWDEAMVAYTQAELLVEEVGDDQQAGLLYMQMGNIYRKYYDFPKSLIAYQKAETYYAKADKPLHRLDAIIGQSSIYIDMNRYEESYPLLQEILPEVKASEKKLKLKSCLRNLITVCINMEKWEEANLWYDEFVKKFDFEGVSGYFLANIAYLHMQRQHPEKSQYYLNWAWRRAKDRRDSTHIYLMASYIHHLNKEYDLAYNELEYGTFLQNEKIRETLQQPILTAQRDYLDKELEFQTYKLRMEKLLRLISIAFLVFVAAIAIYWLQKKLRRDYRRKLQQERDTLSSQHKQEAEMLMLQIAGKQRELEVMGNRLKLLFGANSLQLHPDSIRAAQVILVLTKDRKCDLSRDRALIRHWLNITKDNFVTRLNSLHPELKEHYIDICCLMVLGLSVDEVADIMNVAPSTVSRYITQIGIDLKLPTRGKKGFLEFLNAFVLVKGE